MREQYDKDKIIFQDFNSNYNLSGQYDNILPVQNNTNVTIPKNLYNDS